jgi:hypothetical protein
LTLKYEEKKKTHREMYADFYKDKPQTLKYYMDESSEWADYISLKSEKMKVKNNLNKDEQKVFKVS